MTTYEIGIGDQCKEYIYTVIGQCIGCIEFEVAQDLSGNKIKVVTNTHGGVGFITENAKGAFENTRYINKDDFCTVPDNEKRSLNICNRCWMKRPLIEETT